MKFEFDGCGSKLRVELFDVSLQSNLRERSKNIVEKFENTYSRFIAGNYLDTLNKTKQAPHSSELVSLLQLAKKVSVLTDGYFDITVLPFLENRGYGISDFHIEESYGSEYIEIGETDIFLKNNVSIDLGSLGKGYIIDMLYKLYEKYSENFIIDFGGDIRVKGKHTIFLEDPTEVGKLIGEIELQDMAIAASSPIKRQFGDSQHLINIKNPDSQSDIEGVYVTHQKALFADIFSTALFVSPPEIGEKILRETLGLTGYIKLRSGKIIASKDFTPHWYKKG